MARDREELYDDDEDPPPGVDPDTGDELPDDGEGRPDDQTDDADDEGDPPLQPDEDDDDLSPDPPGTERNAAGRLIDSRTKKLLPEGRAPQPGTPGADPRAGLEQGADDGAADDGAPQPPEIPPDATPVTFTADRQQWQIPGTYETDDGSWVITPQGQDVARRIWAAGQHAITEGGREVRTLRQQITELTTARSTREQALEQAQAELAVIMRDPAKLMEFAEDLQRNWDLLNERAQRAALEAENKRLKEAPRQQDAERQQSEVEEYRQSQLEKAIYDRVGQRYSDVGFTLDDLVPAYRTLHKAQAVRQATQDLTNEMGEVLVKRGQWYIDWELVDEILEQRKELKVRTQTVAQESRRAAEFNQRRRGVRTPPPAAGRGSRTEGRGGDPARLRQRPRPAQTREEADALLSMPADEANARIGYDPNRR